MADVDRIETCWRFEGPSNRVFECGIYRTDAGLELRAGYGEAQFIRSQRIENVAGGRDLAEEWRQAVLVKGFTEIGDTGR